MDAYARIAEDISKTVTKRYSTSFSMASSLFDTSIKADIYTIYALVRIADEITDTYHGMGASELLDDLEKEVYGAIDREFSANLVVHAFQRTAREYGIDKTLIAPFFRSMHMDVNPGPFDQNLFSEYIHGSAEVVGLMCLKVFIGGDQKAYETLKSGAVSLGAAYQKVNFLRDMKADYEKLGRYYFPVGTYDSFDDEIKDHIISDIRKDFKNANQYISRLPRSSRYAVSVSGSYFESLLAKLEETPADAIKHSRIRVPDSRKLVILAKEFVASKVGA